jgi:hypothetical protein
MSCIYDILDKIASANDEAAVCELGIRLNAVCSDWVGESPDHLVVKDK